MSSHSTFGTNNSKTCGCAGFVSLIFFVALIMSGFCEKAFAGHPSERMSLRVSPSDLRESPHHAISESRQYAQLFSWPFERGFGRRSIYGSPSSDPDERQSGEAKRRLDQQLRSTPPSPSVRGPLLLVVS